MKIKLISVLLTFVTLLCFVSCNGESAVTGDTTKSEDTSSQTTAEEEFFLPDFSDKSDVLSINGRNVTYEEYRYYFLNMKDVYDRGDDAFWEENDYTEEIKKAVLNYLARQYAVEDLAAQYDIKLSEEDYEEIEGMIASNKSDFANESEYNKYLDYLNLTEDSNYRLATVYMLEEKLYEYLTGEECQKERFKFKVIFKE